MKKQLSALLFLVFGFTLSIYAQNKIALIVGISTYAPSTGWKTIHTEPDVEMTKATLIKQGFQRSNIFVLQNELATKSNILLNLEQVLLKTAKKDDLVYFHFSGHGQQMIDLDGDELDRLDECIIPYDAPKTYIRGVYEGGLHLRDDELAQVFQKIRKKIGPNGQLIQVIDACHSGTGLRSQMDGVRGTNTLMAPENYKGLASDDGKEELLELQQGKGLAPIVGFFGSKASELNYECTINGQKMGSLTYAFCKHFSVAGPESTYRGIFERIREEMYTLAPKQSPSVEGAVDYRVLNGTVQTVQPFYKVYERDGFEWKLNGGTLHGLTEGSIVGFFEQETQHPTREASRYTVEISKSDLVYSTVKNGPSEFRNGYVYLLEQQPGALMITAQDKVYDTSLRRMVLDSLRSSPLIKWGPQGTCSVEQNEQADSIIVFGIGGRQLAAFKGQPGVHTRVLDVLKQHTRAAYLRNMGNSQSLNPLNKPDFIVEIIHVEVEYGKIKKKGSPQEIEDSYGNINIKEGRNFRIKISNPGQKGGYFNLINITSSDTVEVLVPKLGDLRLAEDFQFKEGFVESFEFPKQENGFFTISGPLGVDMLKLVVTDYPVDLGAVLKSRGKLDNMRSPTDLELLLASSFFPNNDLRGGNNKSRLSFEKVSMVGLSYKVVKE